MELIFWLLACAVFWTYAGYPLFLFLLSLIRRRHLETAPIEPSATVIISAYNEEKYIRQKLINTLHLDYPKEKFEVIVASDFSTDRTHEIVQEFEGKGVKLVILPERGGKTAAQNAAARVAHGEIIIFTDATTQFKPDTVRKLIEGFADPRVGCIGAELEYTSDAGTVVGKGGSAYWRYEKRVRELEGRVNSLIGVSGCLYAVRAIGYVPVEPDLISDFVIAGDVYSRGLITVYGKGSVSQEKTHEEISQEFEMRVRIIVRSIHALVRRATMLNPFRYGFFSIQLLSHKVIRYLVPEFLLGTLAAGLFLSFSSIPTARLYQILTAGQIAVYLAAGIGWITARNKIRLPLVHIPFYFVHANAAALWGMLLYIVGERKITWTTVR